MKNKRLIFFALILTLGIGLFVLNYFSSTNYGDNKISFSRLFQSAGKVTQVASKSAGRLLPVDGLDEKTLGDEIKRTYRRHNLSEKDKQTTDYLNNLVAHLSWNKKKPFGYEVFLSDTSVANAYAMPGGAIVVTRGLLDVVGSEAELLSIIGHEIGHIELSHCFNLVKYKLASQKILKADIGQIMDVISQSVLRSSYSKTQEAEADMYGFKILIANGYNPSGSYKAFESLQRNDRYDYRNRANILSEYFRSHPPLEERINKYKAEAQVWWHHNKGQKRYVGVENLKQRKTFLSENFGANEWVDDFN
jgi:predicted Zn-dependent protease